MTYGVARAGHRGSTAHSWHHRAGHCHATGASLVSVLKEGKKEVPTTEAAAEAESIFFHQARGPLEAGREDSKPQREKHEE